MLFTYEEPAPTPCTHIISGSISLPFRGSFRLSLTVLVHYRSQDIFSLRGWSLQIQSGLHVSRPTQDINDKGSCPFAYEAFTLFGASFQKLLLVQDFLTLWGHDSFLFHERRLEKSSFLSWIFISYNPLLTFVCQLIQPANCQMEVNKVWALPVSLATTPGIVVYFLFLGVLRCFSSPGYRFPNLYIQFGATRHDSSEVSPFGNLRFKAWLAAPRSLSQLSTSFIGILRQGILYVRLSNFLQTILQSKIALCIDNWLVIGKTNNRCHLP